jgi:hypothetical protein
MALAEYFYRNAQAAAAVVSGFSADLLAKKLESHVVGIAVDETVESSTEAQATLDLTVRLLARLYPTVAIIPLGRAKGAALTGARQLARTINPKIDLADSFERVTVLLVVGGTRVPRRRKLKDRTWYLGSDNWIAALDRNGPVGSGSSNNPIGAGAAACLGAANVFRSIFQDQVGKAALDEKVRVSLYDLRPATAKSTNPEMGQLVLNDVHLVGAGAVGSGVLWALTRMPCIGSLHVIDPEKVSDSNLQRYVMLDASDLGKEKAPLAVTWFRPAKGFSVKPKVSDWARHIAAIPGYRVDTVLSAVDTAAARIQIQASLPRVIFNAWTQKGEAGLSRHTNFLSQMACLACLYMPAGETKNEDKLVLDALKLSDDKPTLDQVRRRLQQNIPTDTEFLQQIATAAGVPYEKLAAFENRPLRELYVDAVCGGQVMEFHQAAIQARAEVPMGFQSAFAGLLIAAELARIRPVAETLIQIDLMAAFPERPSRLRAKTVKPQCMCTDADFQAIYAEKYRTQSGT